MTSMNVFDAGNFSRVIMDLTGATFHLVRQSMQPWHGKKQGYLWNGLRPQHLNHTLLCLLGQRWILRVKLNLVHKVCNDMTTIF